MNQRQNNKQLFYPNGLCFPKRYNFVITVQGKTLVEHVCIKGPKKKPGGTILVFVINISGPCVLAVYCGQNTSTRRHAS